MGKNSPKVATLEGNTTHRLPEETLEPILNLY
jgi:hypothetical protein